MVESFAKSRRGILERRISQQTRLTSRQFAVFQLIVLLADKAKRKETLPAVVLP